MLDILRFQIRQLLRTRVIYLTNLLLMTVAFIELYMDSGNHSDVRETMTGYLPQTLSFLAAIAVFVPFITVGIACGDDFADKTINHELSAGRSRAASYFGRAIPVLIAAPLTSVLDIALPYVLYAKLFGVGDAIPVSYIVQRYLLMLFPMLRLCAFCIFLIFVTKKQLAVVVSSFGAITVALAMVSGSAKAAIIHVLGHYSGMLSVSDLISLSKFDNWRAYDLSLQNFYTYYPQLPASQIMLTVVCSLVIGAVWLLLGYHYFHVDDMN